MTDLKAAAEAAKAAKQSPRDACFSDPSLEAMEAFHHACTPDAILALYAERDEARTSLERLLDPTLHHFRMENGRLDMALTGEAVQHISLLFVEWFRETGTENNIEMSFTAKTEPFERYTVTVQKWGGKTPAEQRIEATARAEAAEAPLASYKEEVERLRALLPAAEGILTWCEERPKVHAYDTFMALKTAVAAAKEAPHAD